MESFWYIVVTIMLAVYVVLDGFDFGLGIIYPFVTKTETDRRMALASIGPIWNGNEVWLIAAGGLLFFAFPRAYAAGFSGFYLALIMVLWLLIFRGLALELRSHIDHQLWRRFWDVAFSIASLLLAIVFGAALGNLIRGVPLNAEGYFFVPLWTDFMTGPKPGIIDWFTLLTGVTSAVILAYHGATYLAMKSEGALHHKAAAFGTVAGWAAAGTTALTVGAVPIVQPHLPLVFSEHPMDYLLPLIGGLALVGSMHCQRRGRDTAAFFTSSLFIFAMLGSVALGMYPHILVSTPDPTFSLTVLNAAAGSYGLGIGVWWFLVGFGLVAINQIYVHRVFRGKVRPETG